MKIPREIEDKFFAGEVSDKIKFGMNTAVAILSGSHKGAQGSIISLLSLEPQTRYIVELSSGSEVQIDEGELAPIGFL